MDWLTTLTAFLMIWAAGPAVLFLTWHRSLPAHDEGLSTLIALCFGLSLYASLSSWHKLRTDLSRAWLPHPWGQGVVAICVITLTIGHLIWTVLATEGGLERLTAEPEVIDHGYWNQQTIDNRPSWVRLSAVQTGLRAVATHQFPNWLTSDDLLVSAQLAETRFSVLPPEQADPTAARHRFRTQWCARYGLAPDICGRSPSAQRTPIPALATARQGWCDTHDMADPNACATYFTALNQEFSKEWTGFRNATYNAIPKPDLRGRDFRKADLSSASLIGIVLSDAFLDGADLRNAQLEGANLSDAQMQGAEFRDAQMQGADLRYANLKSANWILRNPAYRR